MSVPNVVSFPSFGLTNWRVVTHSTRQFHFGCLLLILTHYETQEKALLMVSRELSMMFLF